MSPPRSWTLYAASLAKTTASPSQPATPRSSGAVEAVPAYKRQGRSLPPIDSGRRRLFGPSDDEDAFRSIVRRLLPLAGALVGLVAVGVEPSAAASAASRTWPPFVLVIGLLLVGRVAFDDGVFAHAAGLTARIGGSAPMLFVVLLGLVAVVSAVLNLDTSVVFLTPVLVLVGP